MLNKDIGIDLGTANVLIYIKGEGIVLNEPNIVAIDTQENKVLAVGTKAREMLGRTPRNVKAIKPMKNGVIADFEVTELLLDSFIKKVKAKNILKKPRVLICCPSNITDVEKNAIIEATRNSGASKIYIEEEPKVAALGAGMKINKPSGNMVVDIGGGTTDIAVLSLNDIVTSASINIAGNKFDQDIIKYIKEKYQLLIGELAAETIKKEFANVYKYDENEELTVKGRNLITGLPTTITLSQEDTKKALDNSIEKIVKIISNVLEETPPELSADIIEKGIVLTGGGAMLNGLQQRLTEELSLPVLIAQSPLTCVIEGTKVLLDDIKTLKKIS
ncbi:MAG: rod shape-determining protein [Bacilli bacterium]|nr:rod shape-determining protein [Bacilli bacterium]